MKEPLFYNEDHEYYCVIEGPQNNKFIGVAICHPDDQDMESEKVGYYIALMRAHIKCLQHLKNNILQPQLQGLNNLYHSMNRSKYFNKDSFEARRIRRHIKMTEADINVVKTSILEIKSDLKEYLDNKEQFREKVRKNRIGQI